MHSLWVVGYSLEPPKLVRMVLCLWGGRCQVCGELVVEKSVTLVPLRVRVADPKVKLKLLLDVDWREFFDLGGNLFAKI